MSARDARCEPGERIGLVTAADSLKAARKAVNNYAATSKDRAGRQLLALCVQSHITALQRLQEQLLRAPNPKQTGGK